MYIRWPGRTTIQGHSLPMTPRGRANKTIIDSTYAFILASYLFFSCADCMHDFRYMQCLHANISCLLYLCTVGTLQSFLFSACALLACCNRLSTLSVCCLHTPSLFYTVVRCFHVAIVCLLRMFATGMLQSHHLFFFVFFFFVCLLLACYNCLFALPVVCTLLACCNRLYTLFLIRLHAAIVSQFCSCAIYTL